MYTHGKKEASIVTVTPWSGGATARATKTAPERLPGLHFGWAHFGRAGRLQYSKMSKSWAGKARERWAKRVTCAYLGLCGRRVVLYVSAWARAELSFMWLQDIDTENESLTTTTVKQIQRSKSLLVAVNIFKTKFKSFSIRHLIETKTLKDDSVPSRDDKVSFKGR
jgi:hypothetical protein